MPRAIEHSAAAHFIEQFIFTVAAAATAITAASSLVAAARPWQLPADLYYYSVT